MLNLPTNFGPSLGRPMTFRQCLQVFLLMLGFLTIPEPVAAQFWPALGGRAVSRDGKWLVPVANPLLSSD